MMKCLGAVMLTAALTAIGISKAAECRKRLSVLQSVLLMLDIIKSELCTNRATIIRIIECIKQSARGDVKRFADKLKGSMDRLGEVEFSTLWHEAVTETLAVLPEECLSELISLGASLGRYNADMQGEAIDRCKLTFNRSLEELRPQSAKMQKMYIGLYGGVGLIAAVMLI